MLTYEARIVDDRNPDDIRIREIGFDGPFEIENCDFPSGICARMSKNGDCDPNHDVFVIVPKRGATLKISGHLIHYRAFPFRMGGPYVRRKGGADV